ncbi:MAG: zinc ribbon domain-containing protein [Thermodesulfobacteriota bacterium]
MPIYEYRCCDCEQIFEEWQKGFEDKDVPCPVCGHKADRIISNTAFVLKGTGWYVTDYCRGGSGNGGNGNGNGASGKSSSAESSETAPAKPAAASTPASAESSAS